MLVTQDGEASPRALTIGGFLTYPTGAGFAGLLGEVTHYLGYRLVVYRGQVHMVVVVHVGCHGGPTLAFKVPAVAVGVDTAATLRHERYLVPALVAEAETGHEHLAVVEVHKVLVIAHYKRHGGISSVGLTTTPLPMKSHRG